MSRSGGTISYLPVPEGVPDPDAFLALVLDGWGSAMTARGLGRDYIRTSRAVVLQLCDSSGKHPWEWSPGDVDEWLAHLRGVRGLAHSTTRRYQGAIEGVCEYATSPAYDWSEQSARLFGRVFAQVITEFNRVKHSQANEAKPAKRPFTLRELQQLFDLADLEFERVLESGRKGAVSSLRDSAALKIAYAWGLRVNEVRHLQVVDFSPNARAPYFGDYGNLHVRYGKSKAGRAYKPRNVLTVFGWSAEVVHDWIHLGLPRYGEPLTDLFPTSSGTIVTSNKLWLRLSEFVDELGFPPGLDFHSLRRAYATNLATVYGFDLRFVQYQLGHEHAATTSIYTLPAADFQVRELARVHAATLEQSGASQVRLNRRLKLPPLPAARRSRQPNRGQS